VIGYFLLLIVCWVYVRHRLKQNKTVLNTLGLVQSDNGVRNSVAYEAITKADVYQNFLEHQLQDQGIPEQDIKDLMARLDELARVKCLAR
jgi:hypothetical protein